ncbi:helix-turn-helix domain-containing protein [uncultured Roseobacter sp.]|uniref:helix-turn-helix domain-containing protein n=1 Tax=uncultured Roseobacter sp. TaxID=114847 RepID=UPI002638DC7A|nr:AraC family transcriptional regulator [uncultured Roseobacter sp.]
MTEHLQTPEHQLTRTPPSDEEMSFDGLRLVALPAGRCEVDVAMAHHAINIPLAAAPARMAVNSDKLSDWDIPNGGLSYFASGTDFKIRITNPAPQIILEVSDARMTEWMDWAGDGVLPSRTFLDWMPDPDADALARRALSLLARPEQASRLEFEALCLGLADRAVARFRRESTSYVSSRAAACSRDISRAIEWAEAHLHERSLSVSQMAAAAGLSASRFNEVFRAATSETPYAFVIRRRAERAVDMLRENQLSIAQIAFKCGFSSQSHIGSVFRRRYGETPADIRRSNLSR